MSDERPVSHEVELHALASVFPQVAIPLRDAAAEIERLRARVARLEELIRGQSTDTHGIYKRARRAENALAAAREDSARLEEALQDFADNGTRCDLNPTVGWTVGDESSLAMAYLKYLKHVDENVREIAREAIDAARSEGSKAD